jgi:putative PIN family toxin of toxin-antitoxin system
MRVLLDTNILARAAAGPPGPAHELFLRLTHHEHVLLISQPLTAELARITRYERVRKMHGMPDSEIDEYIAGIVLVAERIDSQAQTLPVVIADPDDDAVVATAIKGRADALCTLDRHLFQPAVVDHCRQQGVEVMADIELLARLRERA